MPRKSTSSDVQRNKKGQFASRNTTLIEFNTFVLAVKKPKEQKEKKKWFWQK